MERRARLRSGGPPRRRSPLKPMSDRRQAELDARAEIREALYRRDRWRCLLAGQRAHPGVPLCWGPLTPHHLRKAGQGGPYSLENLVTLCAGHNSWVETTRSFARDVGLEATADDTPATVWDRLRAAGLVAYHWDRT
jgi:hypothetical protein